jgi:hypothetical protein
MVNGGCPNTRPRIGIRSTRGRKPPRGGANVALAGYGGDLQRLRMQRGNRPALFAVTLLRRFIGPGSRKFFRRGYWNSGQCCG